MGNLVSETTNVRTGSKSLKCTCSNANGYARKNVTIHKQSTNYIHFIVWAKSSANSTAKVKIDGTAGSDTSVGTSGWTMIKSSKSITGSGTQGKNFDVLPGLASGSFYLDDAIIYYSTNSTTDITAPTAATGASATTSEISWTCGSDANTGIQNTLIWKRTTAGTDNLSLNNQGVYAVNDHDQSGKWTLLSATVAADATSYSGTFVAGEDYAIVHRDLAYNYSTPTYVTVSGGGGGDPVAPTITSPASEPAAVTYCVGDAITALTVVATGSPTPTFTWYSNTSKSTSEATELTTGASYTPSNAAASDLYYYCVASNTEGNAQSEYFHVTVKAKPAIAWVNAPANGNVGDADFVASVTTTPGEQTVSWASSVEGAATVTNGTIHYVAPGFTNISAEFTYSGSDYCEEKASINKDIVVPITTDATGANDKYWYYTDAVPGGSPDDGLNYGNTQSGAGMYGVKLNSDGYAWFAKPAVAGTLRVGAFKKDGSGSNYVVNVYACDADGDNKSETPLGTLTTPHVGGVSGTLDIDASVAGIRIERNTSSEGVLYFVEFKAAPPTAYSVTYMPNGGSGAEYVVDDDATQIAENPFTAPTGKAFAGWNTSATGEGVAYAVGAAVPSDLILYAQWANKYTVTLMPAGGTCASYTGWIYDNVNDKYTKEVSDGTELTLPTFTKANRTFKTWRNAIPADVTSPITVTADVTLTAVWNATVENVIYSWESDGTVSEMGGTATSTTNGGTSFDNAELNVSKADYYCIQLNGKADYSTNYVQITLSGEEKVKAGDKVRYTGFYQHDDPKNAAPKMRAADGTAIFNGSNLPNINSALPRTDTHTVPEGINTATVQLTRHQTQSSSFLTKLQIIRETQVEESELLTVTFVYHDGATANTTVEVASGQKVAKPADPTWAHHRFAKWQKEGVDYDFSSTVTTDITLDATWTQLYTISFANGGGSGDAPAAIADKAQGETFTVPANTFTAPEGKEFWKWNDGTSDYLPEATYTVGTANVTLTAVWRTPAAHYAITYNKGEHGTGSIDAGDKTEDVAFTLSSERFTRDGYVQTGWAESDGGAQAYALGGSYTANAAIELFPVWTALDTYTASFSCSASAPAGWTFSSDESWADNKTIAAYVCKFVENSITTPKTTTGDGTSDDDVAFAKNTDAIATYDLGITTTVGALNVTLVGGSSSAFDETIEYLGSDGTTVKKTYTNSLSAGNWKDNAISKTDIVDDVRYIRVHGASKWVVMKSFSVKYIETRTKYNVNFAPGAGEGTMDAVQYIAGAEVTLPACTFTAPTGKEFDAWVVTKTASGDPVSVTDGKFTMPAEAVTASATWMDEIIRYTVAYYDGETKLGEEDVEAGENPADYATYQPKDNYVFVGWYNNSDLAPEHAVANIATEEINADANYYGKWALDLQVTKIVFSNGFDAFIKNNTVSAYYMAGESAPTMTSYEKNANVKDGGVAIVGNKVVLTGTDDSEKEYDLTLEAVTPMTSYDLQTFDGNETYVKTGNAYHSTRKWVFSKSVEEASNKRISEGKNRLYFFVGGSADKATFTSSADNRAITVYVNNVIVPSVTHTAANGSTFDIPLDPNDANNMIAIISNQTSGDGGVGDLKLNEHVVSTDVTLSSLTVNDNAVDLASGSMVAGVMTFNYELPYGTVDAPTVAAVANDAFASVGTITQAASATGTATFTVTAEDGITTQDYAVNFSIARFPTIVIWDGSTMSDIATSPISGMSWVKEGINAEDNAKTCSETGKSYSKALNISGNTKDTRYLSITIPDDHVAKISLVYRANGADERSLIIATSLGGTIDETAISYVTCVNKNNDLYIMQSSYCSGTVYINTTSGFRLYEITALLYPIDYTRDVTEGRYGTICLPQAGVMVGASIFEIAYYDAPSEKIFFDEVLNGTMVAGTPYIFLPNDGVSMFGVHYTDDDVEPAGSHNGLVGFIGASADEYYKIPDGEENYIIQNNQYREVPTDAWARIKSNRAYIHFADVPTNVVAPLPGRRRMSIGAAAPKNPTGLDELNAADAPVKVMINGELFILRGEKMYDATGRLVK